MYINKLLSHSTTNIKSIFKLYNNTNIYGFLISANLCDTIISCCKYNSSTFYKVFISLIAYIHGVLLLPSHCLEYFEYLMVYYLETERYTCSILESLESDSHVLDFGCGVCELWLENMDTLERQNTMITGIDLNDNIINIISRLVGTVGIKRLHVCKTDIFNKNLDIKKYSSILLIGVLMQLHDPSSILAYIWDNNPNCSIIIGHAIFSENVQHFLSPIKEHIFPYLPVLNTMKGKAMTYNCTKNIVELAGGTIDNCVNLSDNRKIFICKKKMMN